MIKTEIRGYLLRRPVVISAWAFMAIALLIFASDFFGIPAIVGSGLHISSAWFDGIVDGAFVLLIGAVATQAISVLDEERLHSEIKYATLVEQANDGIIIIQKGKIVFANRRMTDITGVSLDTAGRGSYLDFISPEDRVMVTEKYRQRIAGEKVQDNYEVRIIAKDGKTFPADINASLIQYHGEPAEMAIIRDISERKQAEVALNFERDNFQNLLETSPFAIQIVSYKGELVYANRTMLDTWNYPTFEEMKAVPLELRYTEDSVRVIRDIHLRRFTGNNISPFVVTIVRKDGGLRDLNAYNSDITWNGTRMIQIVYQDITERIKAEKALSAEKNNFQNSLEMAPFGIQIISSTNKVVYTNRTMLDLWGFESLDQLKGVGLDQAFTPESAALIRELRRNKESGQNPSVYELTMICVNGQLRNVRTYSKDMIWNGDKCIQMFYEDITDRKKTEEELFRRAMLLDAVTDGILLHDLEGNILFANENMCQAHGLKREQLLHLDILDRVVSDVEPLETRIQKMRRQGLLTSELKRKDHDGSIRSIEVLARIVQIKSKELVLVVSRDVSERKQAEALYRSLTEDSPVGIYIAQNGKFVFCNEAFREATGYNNGTLLGMDSLSLIHPYDRAYVRENSIAMLKGESNEPYESRYFTKSDETRWALERVSSIVFQGQKAVLGNFLDITDMKLAQNALRETKEKYEHLVDNVGVGVFVSTAGTPGKFVQANRVMEQITGYSRDELQKLNVEDTYITPADRQSKLERFLIDGTGIPIERLLKKKDGTLALTRSWLTATRSSTGEIVSYEGIMEDITERGRMEESLRFSDAAFRSIHEGIFSIDNRFVITSWNLICEKMFGVKANEAIGKLIGDVVELVEQYPGQNQECISKLLAAGHDQEEQVYRTPRGDLWVDVHTQAIESEGERTGWVTLVADITERRKAESALTQSEEKLKLMFQSVNEGIVVADLEGYITDVNRNTLEMLGIDSREKVIGRSILEFIAPVDREKITASIYQDPQNAPTFKEEVTALRVDGETISLEVSAGAIKDASEKVIGSISTLRDVTEEKRLQQQLIAQDRLASIGQLVSGVAHELNNPLTSVIGFSELILENGVPEDLKENLSYVYNEAQRAARIVKDLLTFARKHSPVRQVSDVNKIIEGVLRIRAYDQKVNNIDVVNQLDPTIPQVMADYYQMQQVFFNLIVNAEYFMIEAHKRGVLVVKTERIDGVLRILISDDGPGISKENLKKIFDPFYTTKDVGKGTGLGLSICHGIVGEHGGRIYATSVEGCGATFVVELPILGD